MHGQLSLETLLAAYRRGLYPLAHVAPLKWWSPPQRSALLFNDMHISKNLGKTMRQHRYSVTFDRDIEIFQDADFARCAHGGAVAGNGYEFDTQRDIRGPHQIAEKSASAFQHSNKKWIATGIIARNFRAQLTYSALNLLCRK